MEDLVLCTCPDTDTWMEQVNGKVLPTYWVGRPYKEWMEEVSEVVKQCSQMTCVTLSAIDDMVNGMADGEVIEKIIDQSKRSCSGTKNLTF
eukprot:6554662-Ditylum_brightwellii.AAC.1